MRNNLERFGANDVASSDLPPPEMLQQQSQQTQNLNFIVPTEHISLPSKGLFYPQHHPLHRKETIEIKQMTAKEEDILTSKNLLKKGVALDKLIQSLVVDKRINTDSLTVEDRGAIILAARISAYGADYTTIVACPSCGEKNKNTFDLLEKLDLVENSEPVSVDENGLFSVSLPRTGWLVKCRALNGFDEKAMLRMSEAKKNNNDGDSLLTQQLKMTVVAINDVTDKDTLQEAINNMPAKDAKHLRNVYQETLKGVDMRHTFSCRSCDHTGELEVPLTADFFWFK